MPLAASTIYVKIPDLNPLRWLKYNNNTRDDFFVNELADVEQEEKYYQIFEQLDPINAQIQILPSVVTAYKMELVDQHMQVVKTASASTLYTDAVTGFRYVHFNCIPAGLVGCYFAKLSLTVDTGSTYIYDVYYSEPLDIQSSHEYSIQIDYRHDENDYDMVFQPAATGLTSLQRINYTARPNAIYRIRVHGGLWEKNRNTGSVDVLYFNESHDPRLLHSTPFRSVVWSFGNARGFPYWMYDKLARVFACSDTSIEGVYYTKDEGAELEKETVDRYPMVTASLAMLPKENTYSQEYSTTVQKKPRGIGSMTIGFDFIIS